MISSTDWKLFFVTFLVLSLFLGQPSPATPKQNEVGGVLAVLFNDTEDRTNAESMANARSETEVLNPMYVDLSEEEELELFLQNYPSGTNVGELWLISDEELEDATYTKVGEYLVESRLNNVPIVLWTPFLADFHSTILSGITSDCVGSTAEVEEESFQLAVPNRENLSEMLGRSIPSSLELNSSLIVGQCTPKDTSYMILELDRVGLPLSLRGHPLAWLPDYRTDMVVLQMNFPEVEEQLTSRIFSQLVSKTSMQSFQTYNELLDLIIDLSAKIASRSLSTPPINGSSETGTFSNPSNTSGPYSTTSQEPIDQIQKNEVSNLPFLAKNLPSDLTMVLIPGSIVLVFLGLIAWLLRRFWSPLILTLVGLLAVLEIPTRSVTYFNIFENENRKNIFDAIESTRENGLTLRQLAQQLRLNLATVIWHLEVLEDFKLVVKTKINREIVLVSKEHNKDFDPALKELELGLRSSKGKKMLLFLKNTDPNHFFGVQDVVQITGWNRKTASQHLDKLRQNGVLVRERRKYRLSPEYSEKIAGLAI